MKENWEIHWKDYYKILQVHPEAELMKGRDRIITGYNAQTMVSPLALKTTKGSGMLITATKLVNTAADSGQLTSMLEQAEELTGERVPITLADGGYHTVANLETGEQRGQTLVMTERYKDAAQGPYFKDPFLHPSLKPSPFKSPISTFHEADQNLLAYTLGSVPLDGGNSRSPFLDVVKKITIKTDIKPHRAGLCPGCTFTISIWVQ